jgi:hypothetical protein
MLLSRAGSLLYPQRLDGTGKGLLGINTLAYSAFSSVTKENRLALTPWENVIKLFVLN